MSELVLSQSRLRERAVFRFQEDQVVYTISEIWGNKGQITVAYDQIPSRWAYYTSNPRPQWPFVFYGAALLAALYIFNTSWGGLGLPAESALLVAAYGLYFVDLLGLMRRRHLILPLPNKTKLIILMAAQKDEILAELEKRRDAALRQKYFYLDESPARGQFSRILMLRYSHLISETEYQTMCQQLGCEDNSLPPAPDCIELEISQRNLGRKNQFLFHADYLEYRGDELGFNVSYSAIAAPRDYRQFHRWDWTDDMPWALLLMVMSIFGKCMLVYGGYKLIPSLRPLHVLSALTAILAVPTYFWWHRLRGQMEVLIKTPEGDIVVLPGAQQETILKAIEQYRQRALDLAQQKVVVRWSEAAASGAGPLLSSDTELPPSILH